MIFQNITNCLNINHLFKNTFHFFSKITLKIFAQNFELISLLSRKIEEAIYAFVVADTMGGSVENYLPEQTKKQFSDGDFTKFLHPTAKKYLETGLGKGNGHTTDDTLNLESLIGCYLRTKNHLDANRQKKMLIFPSQMPKELRSRILKS